MTERAPLDQIRVAEAMHAGVVTCPPDAPLLEVAGLMALHRIHCVVVREDVVEQTASGAPWGIVSDLDLAAMATRVVMVVPDETLTRAAQLMAEHGTAHVLVVDPVTAQPVGVLSTLDLAHVVATSQPVLV